MQSYSRVHRADSGALGEFGASPAVCTVIYVVTCYMNASIVAAWEVDRRLHGILFEGQRAAGIVVCRGTCNTSRSTYWVMS